MSKSIETSTESEQPPIRPRMVQADVTVPDFTAEWGQIREDLESEEAGALRIGQNLIKIRDRLKPLGLWLKALSDHGMSQPQASRYIRYAELSPHDRAVFQRVEGFSLSEAAGERRGKKGALKKAGDAGGTIQVTQTPTNEIQIPVDELSDRLAEIGRRLKLAIQLVDMGESYLAEEVPEDTDQERWKNTLSEVATDVRALIEEGLEAALKKRLLPGSE